MKHEPVHDIAKAGAQPARVTKLGTEATYRRRMKTGILCLWVSRKQMLDKWELASLVIRDFWVLDSDDEIIATNLRKDLPPWFKLHAKDLPQASLSASLPMIAAGMFDGNPMDGPHIWRVHGGDWLVFIDLPDDHVEAVYAEWNLLVCVNTTDTMDFMNRQDAQGKILETAEFGKLCLTAMTAVIELGPSRDFSPEWFIF